jgi:hypothetical protein
VRFAVRRDDPTGFVQFVSLPEGFMPTVLALPGWNSCGAVFGKEVEKDEGPPIAKQAKERPMGRMVCLNALNSISRVRNTQIALEENI